MGRDKALARLGGRTLVSRAVDRVRAAGGEPLIVGMFRPGIAPPDARFTDETAEGAGASGPLPALRHGLRVCGTRSAVALACDLPLIPSALLRRLAEVVEEYEAVVPRVGGELQVLAAAYTTACLPAIEERIRSGRLDVHGFLDEVRLRILEEEELRPFGGAAVFLNVNTEADLARAAALLGGSE
jgi:molybdopterin-guanine dinucleotide biosynthesis protein A